MKQSHRQGTPPGLEGVARRLRASRPTLGEQQADRMVTHIARRSHTAAVSRRRTQEIPLRSRVAVLVMLVLGFAVSSTGVGLAISGSDSSSTSATQQYKGPDQQEVLGNDDSGGDDSSGAPADTVAGETASGANPTQETRQATVESGDTGSSLPFTGFAAVPVMLIGVALLGGGFVLRRRTSPDR